MLARPADPLEDLAQPGNLLGLAVPGEVRDDRPLPWREDVLRAVAEGRQPVDGLPDRAALPVLLDDDLGERLLFVAGGRHADLAPESSTIFARYAANSSWEYR